MTNKPHNKNKGESITIEQIASSIGRKDDQIATLKGLGLRRIRHRVTLPNNPSIFGMVKKLMPHLVKIVN